MAQLRQDYQAFVDADTEVVVLGPEKQQAFQKYWDQEGLPFVGLPDPRYTVLRLYGQQVKWLKLGRMPAQMVVDKSGTLRFLHYGNSMSDIPATGEMLSCCEGCSAARGAPGGYASVKIKSQAI